MTRVIALSLTGLLVGCATSDFGPGTVLRPAADVPETFASDAPAEPLSCSSPLWDARNGVRLTLVRSANGEGDYTVADARYDVGRDELLRVDCSTGAAIGIVRR